METTATRAAEDSYQTMATEEIVPPFQQQTNTPPNNHEIETTATPAAEDSSETIATEATKSLPEMLYSLLNWWKWLFVLITSTFARLQRSSMFGPICLMAGLVLYVSSGMTVGGSLHLEVVQFIHPSGE